MSLLVEANWPSCPHQAADITKTHNSWLRQLCSKLKELEEKVNLLEKENVNLKNELNKKTNESNVNGISFSAMLEKKGPKNDAELMIMSKTANELNERKKIEKNIVICGCDETIDDDLEKRIEADKLKVEGILEAIGVDKRKCKKITRIATRRINTNEQIGKSNKIIVEMVDVESKKFVLKNAKSLSCSNEYKSVYINSDKTRAERELNKRLRIERNERNKHLPIEIIENGKTMKYKLINDKKFYWGIRNDELCLVEKKVSNL